MPKNNQGPKGTEITNYHNLRDKIYTIRGAQVMLDADLAELYGYETRYLNRQVARNKAKFEGEEFMFRLTWAEVELLRCQNGTLKTSQGGHIKYLPYAFTEQGIYMLMTVLKGELAIKQSRALVMAFKVMKDYILEANSMLKQKDQLQLVAKVIENTNKVAGIESKIKEMDHGMEFITKKLGETVTRSEISDVLLDFSAKFQPLGYLIMDGEPAKASETYIGIYAQAQENIIIADDYISIKTLRHLQKVKSGVMVTILSDNVGHYLTRKDYQDFKKEFPGLEIRFIQTCRRMHDRFIILDFEADNERIYHCGASAKDAGKKITAINEMRDIDTKKVLGKVVKQMMKHPELELME